MSVIGDSPTIYVYHSLVQLDTVISGKKNYFMDSIGDVIFFAIHLSFTLTTY